ncbi:MAG: hypothetical protein RLZ75_2444, partial [Pseudomonadota bacterium]
MGVRGFNEIFTDILSSKGSKRPFALNAVIKLPFCIAGNIFGP